MKVAAEELAEYIVCPEAWRLRRSNAVELKLNERSIQGITAKVDWLDGVKQSTVLVKYQKIIFFALLALTSIVFIIEFARPAGRSWINLAKTTGYSVPEELVYLLLMFGTIITLWRILIHRRDLLVQKTGMTGEIEKTKNLYSEKLELSSSPDSIVLDGGTKIPVDVYPMAKKVRDRHITRLIGHLIILKDLEGEAPPHGTLLMGEDKREVKISLNSKREEDFFKDFAELKNSILTDKVIPSPDYYKCRNCDFFNVCKFAILPREKN